LGTVFKVKGESASACGTHFTQIAAETTNSKQTLNKQHRIRCT